MTSVVLLVLAAICFYLSYSIVKKHVRLNKKGSRADGVIYDHENKGDLESAATLVIRFLTSEKEWITKPSLTCPTYLKKGTKVTVMYNPNNPNDFVVKSIYAYILAAVPCILGLIFVSVSLYYLFVNPAAGGN